MDDLNIIDRFTETFVRYIDSGFGLLAGDVAVLTCVLVGLDIVLGEQLGDEAAVAFRDPIGELTARQLLPFALERRRHDDVGAVRLTPDVVVDPGKFLIELFGGVGGRPQHTEAAGVGHRGDDVAAVAEREKREIDTELLTDGGFHTSSIGRTSPSVRWLRNFR